MDKLKSQLLKSFKNRDARPTIRLFHGDTEGDPRISIEKFSEISIESSGEPSNEKNSDKSRDKSSDKSSDGEKTLIWITEKERENMALFSKKEKEEISFVIQDYFKINLITIVWLFKPMKDLPPIEPDHLTGEVVESLKASELNLKFLIKTKNVRHPGLFLDHYPLRKWMIESGEIRGDVLNTFSYTGSLSCAAFKGGASSVTTLDLSKATIEWAKENWKLNQFPEDKGDFIYGDYFEWMPRFKKKEKKFDVIILDPPSFSRGKTGTFSTSKNLHELHSAALSLLRKNGLLISSINSEIIRAEEFKYSLESSVKKSGRTFKFINELKSEPLGFPNAKHLKGFIYRILS